MAQTLKFGNGTWATKKGSTLAYNDEGGNFKPLPFTATRSTSATRVNKEGLIEVVSNEVPRIDYTDSEDGVFLLEKASTNLIPYSEDFSQSSWLKVNNAIVSATKVISPDGTLNASQIIFDGTNQGRIEDGISGLTQGAYYTVSVYARVSSGTQVVEFGSVSDFEYTLTTKWQRLTSTEIENDTVGYPRLICNDNAIVEIYGFQLEQNSVASSYIPTQGTIQTRVAETANGSGNSEVFNSEGVLFANIAANSKGDGYKLISITDSNSGNSFVSIGMMNSTTQSYKQIRFGGVNLFTDFTDPINQTSFNKIAIKYKSGDSSFYVNGFEIDSSSVTYTTITPMTELKFSYFQDGDDFYGKTKEIAYYDEILTDLELETLTSYRSWLSMVKELNLNIIHNE